MLVLATLIKYFNLIKVMFELSPFTTFVLMGM